jgi:hypothetical protein
MHDRGQALRPQPQTERNGGRGGVTDEKETRDCTVHDRPDVTQIL